MKSHILAHQRNGHRAANVFRPVNHGRPLGQVGSVADEPQPPHHRIGQALPLQHQRHLIQNRGGEIGDGVVHWDVAEQGNLI